MGSDRVIITRRGVYAIPEGMEGIPIEEAFPGMKVPASMQGAKLYHTPQGTVVGRPERPETTKRTETDTRSAAPDGDKPVVFRIGAREEHVREKDERFAARLAKAYEKVKITAHPMRLFGQWKADIEKPKIAADEARVLLMRHFPEGPGRAAVALKAAKRYRAALDKSLDKDGAPKPKILDLARRWGMFCHDLGNAQRTHYDAGYRPAMIDPYAIDFSKVRINAKDRKAAMIDRVRKPERGGGRER